MEPRASILHPVGVLDATMGNQLRREIGEAIDAGHDTLLIDLEAVTFMDSNGFGSLITCLKKTREANRSLHLCGLNPQVRLVLELTGTDGVFSIHTSQTSFHQSGG